jgi:hypothetical protein
MHPFYLDTLRLVLKELGLGNKLVNPSAMKTKGECVTQCRDLELLSSLVPLSVSCSHGSRRQDWARKKATNCGYCVPCLFRRAALHAAKLDSGNDYGVNVCADELTVDSAGASADDLRAVTSALRHFDTAASIRKAITGVALVQPINDYVDLVQRGLNELRSWIEDSGSTKLRTAAGVSAGEHA